MLFPLTVFPRKRRKGITRSAAELSESSVSRKLMTVSYGKQILEVLDSGIFGASLSAASNTSPTHDGQTQRHQTAKVRFTLRSLETNPHAHVK